MLLPTRILLLLLLLLRRQRWEGRRAWRGGDRERSAWSGGRGRVRSPPPQQAPPRHTLVPCLVRTQPQSPAHDRDPSGALSRSSAVLEPPSPEWPQPHHRGILAVLEAWIRNRWQEYSWDPEAGLCVGRGSRLCSRLPRLHLAFEGAGQR